MPFPLGRLVATPTISEASQQAPRFQQFLQQCIQRHEGGDWGELTPEDTVANNQALKAGDRLLSKYQLPPHLREATGISRIWVLTEADRSATVIMQPEEY